MTAQKSQAPVYDTIAGAVLVFAGLIALVVRLGVLNFSRIPIGLVHWWPLMLIIAGLVLWYAQMEETAHLAQRRIQR